MLQYILNATAIWLISLIMFDLFLRRESYHTYNRFYLLFTFLLGCILPLLHWQQSTAYIKPLQKSVENVMDIKQNIVTTAANSATFNLEKWLLLNYLLGVLVATALLIIDTVKLVRFYSAGKRAAINGWTVIETGAHHAPFSFIKTLFISSREQYSEDEWHMILTHEQCHTALFHIADVMLMQVARILFWFHPLVYVYSRRLLIVHEYQADHAAKQRPDIYGRFLVEQAVMQSGPSLSNSFNRSPIKKRLIMLTRRSTAIAKTKMLVFIPLLLVCLLCFSKHIFSQKKAGKYPPMAALSSTQENEVAWHTFTNFDQILANPRVLCIVPGGEVVSFTFSIQQKGHDYIGPFFSKSADLTGRMIETIKKVKASDTARTKIYIEDIVVRYNGKDTAAGALIYTVIPALAK